MDCSCPDPKESVCLHKHGIDETFHFDTDALDKATAIAALRKQFGIGDELIEAYYHPYRYLNHDLIREKKLDLN